METTKILFSLCFVIVIFAAGVVGKWILTFDFSIIILMYRKVVSSNTSRLEAHAGIYSLLMKGIFEAYVLWPFDKKLILN